MYFTKLLLATIGLITLGSISGYGNTGANLDQCQNGSPSALANFSIACGTTVAQAWANGDINGSNSGYREADGVPYRAAITGLLDGGTSATYTIRLQYDFTKGGVYALDRLTRYNLTQNASPCAGNAVCNSAFQFLIPAEVPTTSSTAPGLMNGGNLSTFIGTPAGNSGTFNDIDLAAGVPNFSRKMDVWITSTGTATFVSAGQNWTGTQSGSFNDGFALQSGVSTGDSTREFALVVTVSGCPQTGCTLMLGWSGHVATATDWGTGKGAGSISGAPFHMRLLGVDTANGTSGGNQDRSTQLSGLGQSILTVNTACVPSTDPGMFNLAIGGTNYVNGAASSAGVACGGTTGSIKVTSGAATGVAETAGNNTSLSTYNITWSCTNNTSGTGSSFSVTVASGAGVTCTITNTVKPAQLTLTKTVINDSGGSQPKTAWTLQAAGSTVTISGKTGDASITNASVPAGTYALSESGPDGYSASAWSCSGGSLSGSSISLNPGDTASCGITNDDKPAQLTLVKYMGITHGGSSVVSDWTLQAAGPTVTVSGKTGDTAITSASVPAGVYTLSESGPAGYSPTSWNCSGGTLSGNQLTLGLGNVATCTITNNDIAAQLTLSKQVNGGPTAATFTFNEYTTSSNLPGKLLTSLTAPPTATQTGISQASQFTLCEMNLPAGWVSTWSVTTTPFTGTPTTVTPTPYLWSMDVVSANYCVNLSVPQGTSSMAIAVNNLTSGGSPRTIGYWKNWSVCGNANQAQTALKNGGAANGFYLLENLLPKVVQFGAFTTASSDCSVTASPTLSTGTAIRILSKNDTAGNNEGSDAAYGLAAQLLAARANIWAGAEHSSTVDQTILAGEALLEALNNNAGFTDSGSYLPSTAKGPLANTRSQALSLASTLDQYNNGLIQ